MMTRWSNVGWGDLDRTFGALDQLRRRMDRLFEEYDESGLWGREEGRTAAWPAVNLYDSDNEFVLQAVVPGVSEEDFDINLTGDVLTLTGERKPVVPEGYSAHRRERGVVKFSRSFTLPARVDAEQAKAQLKNGILTLRLPKAPESQPRRIAVKGS